MNLVKNARKKNPFRAVFGNFPLTDNLMPDSLPIVAVYNYKELIENSIKSDFLHLTEVR